VTGVPAPPSMIRIADSRASRAGLVIGEPWLLGGGGGLGAGGSLRRVRVWRVTMQLHHMACVTLNNLITYWGASLCGVFQV
jgi:hypothetical protein